MRPNFLFWTLVLEICLAEARIIGDRQCDWNGSGLSSTEKREVTPVHLECREGSVSWVYPRGALRLLFAPPLPHGDRDFKVCVRVVRRPDPPDLFHVLRDNHTEFAERFPARLFVEGKHRLVALYAPDDGDQREVRCFRSRRGRAALYVEADPEDRPTRRVATIRYEAKPRAQKHYDPVTAECRPCTEAELEMAFCTSDLVSRGEIVDVEQRPELDSTQLTLRLTKLIRAAGRTDAAVLKSDHEKDEHHHKYYRYEVENSVDGGAKGGRARRSLGLHAHVQVPSACGASHGAGEFLLMATRRLGRYSLVCAPRIEDWIELVERRKLEGDSDCVLQH